MITSAQKILSAKKIALLGPIGSGKSTYAKELSKRLGIVELSVGDILRNPDKRPWMKEIIGDYDVMSGNLLEAHKTDAIMKRILQEEAPDGWVLDGYPRTEGPQLSFMLENFPPDVFLVLDCSRGESIKRISGRRYDRESGRVYNVNYEHLRPVVDGIDDVSGATLTTREDDHPDLVAKRFSVYEEKTVPLIERMRTMPGISLVFSSCSVQSLFQEAP